MIFFRRFLFANSVSTIYAIGCTID